MVNWNVDKDVIMESTKTAIMGELENLLDETKPTVTANYWLSESHNVFASIIRDNSDEWIEVSLELYEDDDLIGKLFKYDTKDMSREELERVIEGVVKDYYGE